MKTKNYTDISKEEIRDIIRFTKPSDVSNFDISFKNCSRGYRGRAYPTGCGYHETASPLVIVSIGKADYFPVKHTPDKPGYLPVELYNRIEAFVFVTAHELRHLWQSKHPRGYRVWGARGQYSERDADAYAIQMVRKWRREH